MRLLFFDTTLSSDKFPRSLKFICTYILLGAYYELYIIVLTRQHMLSSIEVFHTDQIYFTSNI